MPAPHIRADFDILSQIVQIFGNRSDSTVGIFGDLSRTMDILQSGDWVGVGATRFYEEMSSDVLPAVRRLAEALEESAKVTHLIMRILEEADEEASRLLKSDLEEIANFLAFGAGLISIAAMGASAMAAAEKAGVQSVFSGTSSKASAPKSLSLPKPLNEGMNKGWKDSFPGGKATEQGGILVETKDGTVKWIRGKTGTYEDWSPNFEDIGKNKLVGTGHTHPYNSGATDVPFSSGDIDDFFRSDLDGKTSERMMMVQSGDTQFVLARTKEFNNLVSGKSTAEINRLKAEMTKTYDDTVASGKTKGLSFAARHDAAVKAVAEKYNLLYYKGKNGNLTLQ
jgi:WXG100 family type VII secretion target